ncbi:MAG TPA: DUF4082 domain-containing protein [Rhodopila sp.]|nr:DUF4082 domain-containing protein [Rhodopila sp.]
MTRASVAALAAAAAFGFAASAQATPVLSFSTGTGTVLSSQQDFSVGWSFTTTQASTVVALDAYDPGRSGTEVRLYDGLGTLVASAMVSTSDPTEGSPLFYSATLTTPVTLDANATYYVVQDLPAGLGAWFTVDTPVTESAITYGAPVSAIGLGMNPTTDLALGTLAPAYFGPNFDITAIPEPVSLLAFGSGIAGLAAIRRRKRVDAGSAA